MKATAKRDVEVTLVLSESEARAVCELMRRIYVDVDGSVRLSGITRHMEIPSGFDSRIFSVVTNALEGVRPMLTLTATDLATLAGGVGRVEGR